ncbi:Mth938-like domain-containing protein [Hyphomicrobium sp.]|uniref:Mth938-like domain-containing protein n=1 Tax=Hyphomicrobium sp. TaxID=82 RepID=UPI002E331995|nr:MTH938/NDUFAF3 family protein [Hyphomicrobium sp.]HEX2843555.1 MTH938/NDUFAF3 family protein [Hyphomicrobium sp.]
MAARAHLPQQVSIEAYGNGGFRFGGMSHRGSILCLPSGIWEWPVASLEALDRAALADVLPLAGTINFLILGTGRALARPSKDVRAALEEAGLWLEIMDTGAAARTYNILLAEGRPIAAALIAVD